jgi:hypothetical protein
MLSVASDMNDNLLLLQLHRLKDVESLDNKAPSLTSCERHSNATVVVAADAVMDPALGANALEDKSPETRLHEAPNERRDLLQPGNH